MSEIGTCPIVPAITSKKIPLTYRIKKKLKNPITYLSIVGLMVFFFVWYAFVDWLALPRFSLLPSFVSAIKEWVSPDPTYGTSFYTSIYYSHIWASIRRVGMAFIIALLLGIPIGLFMGWKRIFYDFTFPILEMIRPIPILAWVPLAILMWPGREDSIVFLTFLAAFFATILNTLLGVKSIDNDYFRAARCMGASEWDVLKDVIVPGAMPFIFTGLQIAMGACWFSLVAAEIVAGEHGLGYLIWESYYLVQFPVIVIGMFTLGFCGYVFSAIIRLAGNKLMVWKVRSEGKG